ncbi:MAG: ribosomal-processing cysteine protease Prp [Sulfobacillus acidophilus]|uniref:Ribosomal processing cysteine protease Prp n=1 Tax=Sulfobacillus acidophilus TaxID=53633 RepID=A0A2T2WIL8_9FIRM|nr:MAG: ribosomal-processing cysteine protease Prp [Sulfobacillus acidophilus]
MIRVGLWRDRDDRPRRLVVSGHANRGPHGQDIVCAAASALVETLALGLREVVHEDFRGQVDVGHADLWFDEALSSEARAIVETIVRGFMDLAQSESDAVRFVEHRGGA